MIYNEAEDDNDYLQPKNLTEFLNSNSIFQKINVPVDKNRGEIFFMLLKFSMINCLSVTATVNLFTLINTIFETPILPSSKHFLDKLLNSKDQISFHAVCQNCTAYIGEFGFINNIKNCNICGYDLKLSNASDPSYFVLVNPAKQISDLLSMNDEYYDNIVNNENNTTDYIEDVYDGKMYRQFRNSLHEKDKHNFVTGALNTDGAPLYKSSSYSIWPIFLKINELPRQSRMNNLVTLGLWFNKTKPEMTVFLDKLVNIVDGLSHEGFYCKVKNELRNLKLYILSCCVDSCARAPMQGFKQFNGSYGCSWCLHPGQYAEGSMRYPYLYPQPDSRNHEDTVKLSLEQRSDSPYGIKYPSPLINLRFFNIIDGFMPDYMHACLEGVGSQFTKYFLDSKTDDEIIGLDMLMKKIKVPQQVQRLCRQLKTRKDWKAREWENFILYYSLPVLSNILSRSQLDHWNLFVESLYILLKDKIHIDELNEADEKLHKFVHRSMQLYGIKAMTFNVHQMLHICESVVNWGPVWTNSTFCYESANYYMLKAIKCSNGVTHQVVRYINVIHSLLTVEHYVSNQASRKVLNFCNSILSTRVKNVQKSNDTIFFGSGIEDEELSNILRLSANAQYFEKAVINKCLYESCKKIKSRSNNAFAQLKNKKFVQISNFVIDNEAKLVVFKYIKAGNSTLNKNIKIIDSISNSLSIKPISYIERICVHFKIYEKYYICPLPNLLHY